MILGYIRIQPLQPIRTGGIKIGGGYLDTRDYVPGSVIRGALAEWLKLNGQETQILSVVSGLRFGNLFPAPDPESYALPLPGTAVECKLHGGFRSAGGHGVRDTLLPALAYSELVKRGAQFPVPFLLRCLATKEKGQSPAGASVDRDHETSSSCNERMEKVSGYYIRQGNHYSLVRPEEFLQTKVSLSRYRRAAQRGKLYRVVSLCPTVRNGNAPFYFVGRVWARSDQEIDKLCQAVSEAGIGGLTTRGFGRVKCERAKPNIKPLRERVENFNRKLKEVWRDLADLAIQCGSSVPTAPEGTYFSIDLLSPALLLDDDGIPTLRLTLSYQGQTLEPVWWSVQGTFVGGFSTAWGLPKPTSLGAAANSAYVYRADADLQSLVSWLENLENRGIGLRTDEGFGEMLICHPFHEEVQPV